MLSLYIENKCDIAVSIRFDEREWCLQKGTALFRKDITRC